MGQAIRMLCLRGPRRRRRLLWHQQRDGAAVVLNWPRPFSSGCGISSRQP